MSKKFKVARVSDFKEGDKKRVLAGETPLMLALVEGKFFAVHDVCSHAKSSLTAGKLDGFKIQCAWHGATFDIRTGQVLALPAAIPVKTYSVTIDGEDILVEI